MNINEILKPVSRSFYLSIRILPATMRPSIAIAYLLARAADTLCDSANLDTHTKTNYLHRLQQLLQDNSVNTESLNAVIPHILHPGEKHLISQLDKIHQLYLELDELDHSLVKKVVMTLTSGMEKDLTLTPNEKGIATIKTHSQLEEYIYLVAGCVGEFWTKISIKHTPELSHWDEKRMSQLGIEFGKALQLTNILKDIEEDFQNERCYLPEEKLREQKQEVVVENYVTLAKQYYQSASEYTLKIPRRCIRLRLAAIWPIMIGIKTLNQLSATKANAVTHRNKIKRSDVYKIILVSGITVFSNFLLKSWIIRNLQT